jgi:hypothetical protein
MAIINTPSVYKKMAQVYQNLDYLDLFDVASLSKFRI